MPGDGIEAWRAAQARLSGLLGAGGQNSISELLQSILGGGSQSNPLSELLGGGGQAQSQGDSIGQGSNIESTIMNVALFA